MQENMWWEPRLYSVNQLASFDMRGCLCNTFPALKDHNALQEHRQQQHRRATMAWYKYLIAVHSILFVLLNKAADYLLKSNR